MNLPTPTRQLDTGKQPDGPGPVMYQRWQDLLFLHWETPVDCIQRTLPKGLTVDTHHGKAFLGVVPFFMRNIRPRFCPTVPGISNFLELNLRTYVFDKSGTPGVWFYSLDASQFLAVHLARTFFNLPYYRADMSAQREGETIEYHSSRKGKADDQPCHYRYTPTGPLSNPEPGSLEFFLLERYILFAVNRSGNLFSGQVHHTPYPVHEVTADVIQDNTMRMAGFESPNRPPDHAIMSKGVDVSIYGIQPVK